MPFPEKGESRSMYVKRAIPEIKGEGESTKQAIGKAEGIFDSHKKYKKNIKNG